MFVVSTWLQILCLVYVETLEAVPPWLVRTLEPHLCTDPTCDLQASSPAIPCYWEEIANNGIPY